MSIKIAITNEKGGCGKNHKCRQHFGHPRRTRLPCVACGRDPQSYATMYYGLYNADDPSLYDAITGVWPVNDAIVKTVFGVDVLKSNTKSMRLEECSQNINFAAEHTTIYSLSSLHRLRTTTITLL